MISRAHRLLLANLADVWEKFPNLRLGQLVYVVSEETDSAGILWNISDEDFAKKLEEKRHE